MLKNIHPLLTGELLAILDDMGHGNEIAIVDANFPANATAERLIEIPGISATDILDAVLTVFPLDDFVEQPVSYMRAPGEALPIYAEFEASVEKGEGRKLALQAMEPADFSQRAAKAYAIISSGERRLYGNVLLRKGVVRD
ncbi:RbsD/FucU family protein [Agrobacterium larrymoorei]|uniref:RbsD/FucU domain-containing protein n=1 Tax=Agrobacterium larrymoorei TaxID=160699 RepID=A0AAF0HFT1_9HYPH|nr:RbsD/FucU domain-containing protein [Agrobacterium larrymoorei]WHA44075.1 RbsD/FucU domain-containing protein [Agrobacterium larrymoorei]